MFFSGYFYVRAYNFQENEVEYCQSSVNNRACDTG